MRRFLCSSSKRFMSTVGGSSSGGGVGGGSGNGNGSPPPPPPPPTTPLPPLPPTPTPPPHPHPFDSIPHPPIDPLHTLSAPRGGESEEVKRMWRNYLVFWAYKSKDEALMSEWVYNGNRKEDFEAVYLTHEEIEALALQEEEDEGLETIDEKIKFWQTSVGEWINEGINFEINTQKDEDY